MYRHHHSGWGWGGGWRGGWGWGGPYRRMGSPLFGGGLGMGGNGLIGDLMAGGVGYMIGRQQAANQQQQYPPQQYPQYQQPPQQYQPQYQQAPSVQGSNQNSQLAQLRLLGQLRSEGVLTDEEFEAQKQKILNGL